MVFPNTNTYLPGVIEIPSSLNIVAVTNAYPMVVTIVVNDVTESNSYIPGQLVRFTVSVTYGMFQLNGLIGQILAVSGSDLSFNIDSRGFDTFVVPPITAIQPASLAPSGSRNKEFSNSTKNLAFQSLNNIGN